MNFGSSSLKLIAYLVKFRLKAWPFKLKSRLIPPPCATKFQAEDLKKTCNDFVFGVSTFKQIADSFIEIFDAVSSKVEQEKMAAIGAQNLLQTAAKHREAQVQNCAACWHYTNRTEISTVPYCFD